MLVNEAWARNVEVKNITITQDYELMVVSVIAQGHPEGAPPFTFIHVYPIPGPNFTQAASDITDFFYFNALEMSGGGAVFLLGDFNQCDITPALSNLRNNNEE